MYRIATQSDNNRIKNNIILIDEISIFKEFNSQTIVKIIKKKKFQTKNVQSFDYSLKICICGKGKIFMCLQ